MMNLQQHTLPLSSSSDFQLDMPLLLDVYFQPILDTKTAAIKGAEALLRIHSENGDLETVGFLKSQQDCEDVNAVDRWVIEQSLKNLATWEKRYHHHLQLHINISEETLNAPDFPNFIVDVLDRHELYPDFLVLEIDIHCCIDPDSQESLKKLRATGVSIAVDNIGKGSENSGYLTEGIFDVFKLDKNLFSPDECQMEVNNQLLRIRHQNAAVVAVGIEQTEQVLWCKRTGIDCFQGYFTSQPLPSDDFESWFLKGQG